MAIVSRAFDPWDMMDAMPSVHDSVLGVAPLEKVKKRE
jgi:hypothetical protein